MYTKADDFYMHIERANDRKNGIKQEMKISHQPSTSQHLLKITWRSIFSYTTYMGLGLF